MFAKHGLAPGVSPMVERAAVPVYKEGRQVGRATSVTWGPTIKKMVGFGSVDKALEKPGTELSIEWTVEGERGKVSATVVPDALPGPAPQAFVTGSPQAARPGRRRPSGTI